VVRAAPGAKARRFLAGAPAPPGAPPLPWPGGRGDSGPSGCCRKEQFQLTV